MSQKTRSISSFNQAKPRFGRINNRLVIYCTNFIYIALIAIPFVSSFSSALVNNFIGFAAFGFLVKKVLKRDFSINKTSISLPFIFLILFSLISFYNSVSIGASFRGIFKLFKYGILFIILSEELTDIRQVKKIATAIIAGLYLASLNGIYQLFSGSDFFRGRSYDIAIGLPRLTSSFPHTNLFAVFLCLFLPVSVALALYYTKGKKKILLCLISSAAVTCLLLTISRGAIFGFAAALVFMCLIRKDKFIIILLILAIIVGIFVLPQNIYDWIKERDSIWEVLLNRGRINIYKTSLNMIKDHPVIGVGVNTFCLNYQKYKIKETAGFTGDTKYYAHNIFLHMAGEVGLLGLAAFLWLLGSLFKGWIRFFKSTKSEFLKICGLGIAAGIIGFLLNGLTETNLYYSKMATLFWFQVGLLLGLYRLNKEARDG